MLVQQLLVSPLANEVWSQPIGLLAHCSPHMMSLTDASYEDLDSFIVAFNFKRCISSDNLANLGWIILTVKPER